MEINQKRYSNNNFTGRCPQIKDAQWVCHVISSNLPHISTTKSKALCKTALVNLDMDDNTASRLLNWRSRIGNKIYYARKEFYRDWNNPYNAVKSTISQLEKRKIGNCAEDARMAEVILKMNGVGNSCCVDVVDWSGENNIDHVVCIFNSDKSPLNGKISKKTIIIDPWLGIADFAQTIFLKYKNIFSEYLGSSDNTIFRVMRYNALKLNSNDIEKLKREYPRFIFHSDRNFMQK